jgi:hypothetical protein
MCDEPAHVVADPDLTTVEKQRALDAMEQDARQLAVATAEGMNGGEETRLHDVLRAKQTLEMPAAETAFSPAVETAFRVVRQTFEAKLQETPGTASHALIVSALDAIRRARDAIAETERTPPPPPGVPAPGSAEELEEEIEKEQLDPGG